MTNIMACIDGSHSAPAVCDYAAWAALRMNIPLTFLHVLDRARYPSATNLSGNIGLGTREHLLEDLAALDEQRARLALEQGQIMLEAARERAIAGGVATPLIRQRHGDLADTLAELEADIRVLVIGKVGEDHPATNHPLIGGNLERVIRTMHRPILITPPEYKRPERIMFAFDGSETGRKGVETIAPHGQLFRDMPCHLVMIGESTPELRGHLECARETLAGAGFEVHTAIRSGEVESALRAYQQEQDIDLMIMGAYGHSRIRQFLVGSTTTNVIRHATMPLLILR